jgi:spoIIIJ-associated protein
MSTESKYSVENVGDALCDFLDKILDAGDFDVDYTVTDEGEELDAYFERPALLVKFEGPDVEHLMMNKGEGLLALEQLSQEVLGMAADEHALLCFDANDFRLMRQQELKLGAQTVAARVRETKTPYRFSPMSSRERRIIHLAMRDETDLRSESSGVGPGRHVVIYPAGMASLPDPPPPPPGRPGGRGPGGGRPGGGGGRDRGGDRGGDRSGGRGGDRRGGDRRGGGGGDRGRSRGR